MKLTRAFLLLLVLALCFSSFAACLPNGEPSDGGSSTTTTTGGAGGGGGGKPDTMDGTYYVSYYMGALTFTVSGTSITAILEDHYYDNTTTHYGTLTLDDTDEDETTVQYKVVWEEAADGGRLVFRKIYYNPTNKTLTTANDFTTYVLEKQP